MLYDIISFRRVHTPVMDYSRKNRNREVVDMERNSKWIFWGLIKSNVEFP